MFDGRTPHCARLAHQLPRFRISTRVVLSARTFLHTKNLQSIRASVVKRAAAPGLGAYCVTCGAVIREKMTCCYLFRLLFLIRKPANERWSSKMTPRSPDTPTHTYTHVLCLTTTGICMWSLEFAQRSHRVCMCIVAAIYVSHCKYSPRGLGGLENTESSVLKPALRAERHLLYTHLQDFSVVPAE